MRFVAFLGVLLLCATSTANSQPASSETEILSAIRNYFDALNRLDIDSIEQIQTDDYVFIQNGQIVDKKAVIAGLRDVKQHEPGGLNLKTDVTLYRVVNAGDRYIVTGRYRFTDVSGVHNDAFTEVWINAGGRWRVQHAHYSSSPLPALEK